LNVSPPVPELVAEDAAGADAVPRRLLKSSPPVAPLLLFDAVFVGGRVGALARLLVVAFALPLPPDKTTIKSPFLMPTEDIGADADGEPFVNRRFPSFVSTTPLDDGRPSRATANSHNSESFVELSDTLIDSVLAFSSDVSVTVISSDIADMNASIVLSVFRFVLC
jgi:hypothetical protein